MFKSIKELERLNKKQLICEILICQSFIYALMKSRRKEKNENI